VTNQRDIAEAFSSHRFRETYAAIAPDVRWVSVGGGITEGKDAVVEVCESMLLELTDTTTDFGRFLIVDGGDTVAVDAVGNYVDAAGVSVISSCDLYEFRDEQLTTITSYTVDVTDSAG
jgi:SnoaL-like domain